MKTLVVKVNRVTRDNYELKYGYDRYKSKDEALKYNQYKEDIDYLLSRINKFGYLGVALYRAFLFLSRKILILL